MSGNEGYSAAEGGSRKRIKTSRTGRRDVSNGSPVTVKTMKVETPVKMEAGCSEGVALPAVEAQQQQGGGGGHVHNETCHHEQSLRTLHADMDAMRQLITCKMCYRFLYEPYGLSCGHTYCYSCLAQWMGNSKTCPDCRAKVKEQPTPTFVIREMVRVFVAKSELLPDGETSEEHEQMAKDEAEIVAKDKANQDIESGGLFRGRFRQGSRYHPVPAFRDEGDNVWRCPSCMVEVEDGRCRACNLRVHVDGETDDDSTLTDSDDDIDEIDDALQDMDHDDDVDLGLDLHGLLESEDFGDGTSEYDEEVYLRRYEIPHFNNYMAPPDRHMRHIFESEGESDESEGSMDGFIDEEVHFEDDATIDESDHEAEPTRARPSASQQRRRPVLSDSDDDVEEVAGPRRRVVPDYLPLDHDSSAEASSNTDNEEESEDEPVHSSHQRQARRRPRTITVDSDGDDDSSDAPPEEGQVDFSGYQAFSPASAQTENSNPVNLISDDEGAGQPRRHRVSGGYDGAHILVSDDSSNDEEHNDDEDDEDDDNHPPADSAMGRTARAYEIYEHEDEEEGDDHESDDSDEQNSMSERDHRSYSHRLHTLGPRRNRHRTPPSIIASVTPSGSSRVHPTYHTRRLPADVAARAARVAQSRGTTEPQLSHPFQLSSTLARLQAGSEQRDRRNPGHPPDRSAPRAEYPNPGILAFYSTPYDRGEEVPDAGPSAIGRRRRGVRRSRATNDDSGSG